MGQLARRIPALTPAEQELSDELEALYEELEAAWIAIERAGIKRLTAWDLAEGINALLEKINKGKQLKLFE